MPQITFRGKKYDDEFEIPWDIRRTYQDDPLRKGTSKSLAAVAEIPTDVQEAYRQALSKENLFLSPQFTNKPPIVEDLYLRSTPQEGAHPTTGDVSEPLLIVIDPEYSNLESESPHWIVRVVSTLLWLLFAALLIYLVTKWLW